MRVSQPLSSRAVTALVIQFRHTALDKADGLPCRRDRELHQQLAEVVWHLNRLGRRGTIALKVLLTDGSPHVRRWIAPHLLAAGDSAAREALVRDSALRGVCGEEARMALRDCLAGRLVSPFGAGAAGGTLLPLVAERQPATRREPTAVHVVPRGLVRRDRRPEREAVRAETMRELAVAGAAIT